MSTKTTIIEMQNGHEVGRFDIEHVSDLRKPTFLALLRRVADGVSDIVCGCREAEGVWPGLQARAHRGIHVCIRVRISHHHPTDCAIGKLRFDKPDALLSSTMFAPGAVGERATGNRSHTPVGPHDLRYLEFSQFAEQAASQASADAFLAANPIRPPSNQPTTGQYFCAWEGNLHKQVFEGRVDAFQAAVKEGCQLMIGVIFEQLAPLDSGECLITGYWWTSHQLQARTLTMARDTYNDSTKRLQGRNGELPPPYVAMALVGPQGVVRKLWIQGVWSDGTHITFAASQNEREHFTSVRQDGGCLFVPLSLEALDRISPLLPQTPRQVLWSYLMDGIRWANGVPTIIEVQGFEPGDDPEYDSDLAKKEPWYRALLPYFEYQPVLAWKNRSQPFVFNKAQWRVPQLMVGTLSHSAATLLATFFEGQAHHPGVAVGNQDPTQN